MISAGVGSARIVTAFEWNRSHDSVIVLCEAWLLEKYSVALESLQVDGLTVEWLVRDRKNEGYVCSLSVSDERAGTKLTVTLLDDDDGVPVLFLEESAFGDRAPSGVSFSSAASDLLASLLADCSPTYRGFSRLESNLLQEPTEQDRLISVIGDELAPGAVLLVVGPDSGPTSRQIALAESLRGVAMLFVVPSDQAARICAKLGDGNDPRHGSVLSIARMAPTDELDVEFVGAFAVNRRIDGVRRLVLRHQLAAPFPFAIEQRRNQAIRGIRDDGAVAEVATAEQLLDEEAQRASTLEQRLGAVELELGRAWEEHDATLRELDALQSRNRFLERALRTVGSIPIDVDPQVEWLPSSCVDALFAAKEELPFLVISALDEYANDLDQHPKRSIWATKIWMALKGLNDYVRAKIEFGYTGGLYAYRQDPPTAMAPILCEYAAQESESTENDPALRKVRTFRVSRLLRPERECYMGAHLKIDKGGAVAPRIHFQDDSAGATQRVHVGYIGPHLPTSSGR